MPLLTARTHIDAPCEAVFARASDFANAPRFITGISRVEMLGEGPLGPGTRFRETRTVFNRDATEEMEVLRFEPPRSYVLGCQSCGCRYRSEFTFTPAGQGTDVELRFEALPLTFLAKVMSFAFRPMMKMIVKQCAKDLADLKASLESPPQDAHRRDG